MNRCLNDLFTYCKGEPKATTITEEVIVSGVPDPRLVKKGQEKTSADGKYIVEERIRPACELSCQTCRKYTKASE